MAGIKAKLTGFNELRKRLDKAAKEMPKEVDAELQASAQRMRGKAIRAAPADQGLLRAEIQSTKQAFLSHGIFSNALYSGYVEFGTKSNVRVPGELQAVAAEIKGSSGGALGAKEAIFAWCKRKGIDERLWYPIFIKIMVQGIKPQPFFFKQLEEEQPNLLRNIENVLKGI